MEQSENTVRLLEMLDNPGKFSDSEIREAVDGDHELYSRLVEIKRAQNTTKDVDVDDAWQRFEHEKLNTPKTLTFRKSILLRVAAVLVAALLMGGLSYAAIKHFVINENSDIEQVATEEKPSSEPIANTKIDDSQIVTEPIVFDNVQLSEILETIAKHYGFEVVFSNKSAKKIRLYLQWNPQEPVENVIEKLNMFERFNVKRDGQKIVVE
jgi:hypothetical protein